MDRLLLDRNIGENLRRLRKEHHLSQYDLIRELSLRGSFLTRSAYGGIELGNRNIKVSDLMLLKVLYDVSFDEFFKGMVPTNIPKLGEL